ncbi:MAG: hypothetical protein M3044_04010 [Thermoproteota archaeon]|nr:hypothetical protein [Thermoproteota archaeon]
MSKRSKILTAAMEEDEDYRRYRAKLEIELNSPSSVLVNNMTAKISSIISERINF